MNLSQWLRIQSDIVFHSSNFRMKTRVEDNKIIIVKYETENTDHLGSLHAACRPSFRRAYQKTDKAGS